MVSVNFLSAGINLTNAGTYRWSTSLPASALATTQQYVLRFIIETNNVNGFPSPGFLIQGGAATTTSSSSISFSTSISSSSTSTSATTLPQSNTQGTGAPPASKPGGLSTGAKVAIGVVVPVVILTLLLGAYCCYRRNKTQLRAVGPRVAEMQRSQNTPAAELPGAHSDHELPS